MRWAPTRLSDSHAGHIPAVACVDAQYVSFIDEQGDLQLETGLQRDFLRGAGCRIAGKTWRRFADAQINCDGEFYVQWLALVARKLDLHVLHQIGLGLIKDRVTEGHRGAPYLKDIPILGWLFTRREDIVVSTETVVVVSAHVVDDERDRLSREKVEKLAGTESSLRRVREMMERSIEPLEGPDPGDPEGAGEGEPAVEPAPAAPQDGGAP